MPITNWLAPSRRWSPTPEPAERRASPRAKPTLDRTFSVRITSRVAVRPTGQPSDKMACKLACQRPSVCAKMPETAGESGVVVFPQIPQIRENCHQTHTELKGASRSVAGGGARRHGRRSYKWLPSAAINRSSRSRQMSGLHFLVRFAGSQPNTEGRGDRMIARTRRGNSYSSRLGSTGGRVEHHHRARPGPVGVARNRSARSATRRCPAATAATCRSTAATACRRGRRQLELERLPVGVQDQVEDAASPSSVPRRRRCCANRRPSRAG